MNFDGFNFDSDTRRTLSLLVSANRLPHAVIIESRSAQKALEVATYLSAFAVCGSGEKPCGACKQCKNAFARAHCDIQYVKPDSKSKTGIYNIDQIRALAGDAQRIARYISLRKRTSASPKSLKTPFSSSSRSRRSAFISFCSVRARRRCSAPSDRAAP